MLAECGLGVLAAVSVLSDKAGFAHPSYHYFRAHGSSGSLWQIVRWVSVSLY